MKYALTFALWIIGMPLLISQEVDITLHQQLFDDAHASIVMLSTDDGTVVHEFFFRDEGPDEDVNFQVYRADETQQLHLTILKEFKRPYRDEPYFRALTLYDIPDHYESDESLSIGPLFRKAMQQEAIKIVVSGVHEWNDILDSANSGSLNYHFRKKKKRLVLEFTHAHSLDMYILLKCNNEDQYRYIYLPKEDVEPLMHFDYAALSNELEYYTFNYALPPEWVLWIQANSLDTGNQAFLQYLTDNDTNQIGLYVPQDPLFVNFSAHIRPPQSRYFHYSINSIELSGLPFLFDQLPPKPAATFSPTGFSIDHESISTADEFLVDYRLEDQLPDGRRSYTRNSFWFVKGKPATHINFILPEIPYFYYNDLLLSRPVEAVDSPILYLTHQYPEGSIKQGVTIQE
jgi:hypothetical protein